MKEFQVAMEAIRDDDSFLVRECRGQLDSCLDFRACVDIEHHGVRHSIFGQSQELGHDAPANFRLIRLSLAPRERLGANSPFLLE